MPDTGQTAIAHRTLDAIVDNTERLDAVYKSDLGLGDQLLVTTRNSIYSIHVLQEGLISAQSLHQLECYESSVLWAHTEGFISAPETSHAIAAAIREAKRAKEEGKEKVIFLNWSGHGLMDLTGYEAFFDGKLFDYELPEEELKKSLQSMDGLPKPPAL